MALTAMEIYKNLPKTNCKECGLPTCMAFAMQVAAKQKALAHCPHASDQAKATLAEASAPPMRLVRIGPAGRCFEIGQETVMFRHEEKFHHPAGVAVRIPASVPDARAEEQAAALRTKGVFQRVGQTLKVQLCAVEVDGCSNPGARAKRLAEASQLPLVLAGKDAAAMKSALEAVKDQHPLIYRADASNVEAFATLAAGAKAPLALGSGCLEELAGMTVLAKSKGVDEMVLAFDAQQPGETLRVLTTARRAALRKNFRALGYPAMVEITAGRAELETLLASTFAAKYASIVLINGCEPWELLPILTTVQNIYTDPQVPNAVEAKLYEIGGPGRRSPVLFTTNFALTYFSVEGEVVRSKVPSYVCVVDTEGLGVLNAYAGDKISPEKVVKTLKDQKVADKVEHRKLIIPGLLPIFRAEIEDTSEWKEVIIGPESASGIPAFLNKTWKP